jgi:hypothetical protein
LNSPTNTSPQANLNTLEYLQELNAEMGTEHLLYNMTAHAEKQLDSTCWK